MPDAPLEKKNKMKCESLVNGIKISMISPESIWIRVILFPKKPISSKVPWVRK